MRTAAGSGREGACSHVLRVVFLVLLLTLLPCARAGSRDSAPAEPAADAAPPAPVARDSASPLTPPPPASARTGRTVRRIEIRGLVREDPARVRGVIKTREGDRLPALPVPAEAKGPRVPRALDEDVRRLKQMDSIADARWELQPLEDGVELIFHVTERPVITRIAFQGRPVLKEKSLREHIQAKEKQYANRYVLKLDQQALVECYRQEGYHFAEVQQRLESTPTGLAVVYQIEAGPRLKVEQIQFEGNRSLKDKELLRVMTTRLGGLFSAGEYDEAMLRADLEAVQEVYRRKGWLDATVGKKIVLDDTKERLYVIVQITEREQYVITPPDPPDAIIVGNHLFTDEELLDLMESKVGGLFAPETFEKDLKAIRDLYGAQGHIQVVVGHNIFIKGNGGAGSPAAGTRPPPSSLPTPRSPRVVVQVTIDEGPKMFVEEIKIRGLRRTQERIARRELTFYPGERLNTAKVQDSKRRLINTGLFQSQDETLQREPVRIRYEPGSAPDRANVIIDLDEGNVGKAGLGFGISSTAGIMGQVSLTHYNFDPLDFPKSLRDLYTGDAFVGAGQRLTLRLTPGTKRQDYRLQWENPSVFDSPYSVGYDLFMRRYFLRDYDEDHAGSTLTLGRRFGRDFRVSLTPGVQDIGVSNLEDDAPADVATVKGHNLKVSLRLSATYDKRDHVWLPTTGYLVKASLENAGSFMGGDVDIVRGVVEARRYFTVWDQPKWGKHVVQVGGRVGLVDATSHAYASGRGSDVPIFERFHAGGIGSVRGFQGRGIGPVDPVFEKQIGGEALLVGNLEYTAPLFHNVIRGVLFLDMGKVGEHASDMDFRDLRASVGFGVRLRFPQFGMRNVPLSLEFGFPIAKEDTDDTRVFAFNLGTGFEF